MSLIFLHVVYFFSWLCAFLFQLNPLFGPQLESNMIRVMQAEWDGLNIEHHPVSLIFALNIRTN